MICGDWQSTCKSTFAPTAILATGKLPSTVTVTPSRGSLDAGRAQHVVVGRVADHHRVLLVADGGAVEFDDHDLPVSIATEYTLAPGSNVVEIRTTIRNDASGRKPPTLHMPLQSDPIRR